LFRDNDNQWKIIANDYRNKCPFLDVGKVKSVEAAKTEAVQISYTTLGAKSLSLNPNAFELKKVMKHHITHYSSFEHFYLKTRNTMASSYKI